MQSTTYLCDLAEKYGTHKQPKKTDFTRRCAPFLTPDRGLVNKVLELGVDKGQSLQMWKDFFPNAEIYGVDIKENCKEYEGGRIHIWIGDQRNAEFLANLGKAHGPFDVVIDDGDSAYIAQLTAFNALWPYVIKSGFYIVENTATSYSQGKLIPESFMLQVQDWILSAQLRGWTIQGLRSTGLSVAHERAANFAQEHNRQNTLSEFDEQIHSVYVSLNLIIVQKTWEVESYAADSV